MNVWRNGKIIPEEEARVSLLDYGFLFGYGVFETLRTYKGNIFRLARHLRRLRDGARALDISLDLRDEEIEKGIYKTMLKNDLDDAYIRITLWKGKGEAGLRPETCREANLAIITRPFTPYSSRLYKEGMKAVIVSTRRGEGSPVSGLKSLNYLSSIIARTEARKKDAEEALLLNHKGNVACGAVSNVFLVSDDVVKTPVLEAGVLNGITREAVIELCRGNAIDAREESVSLGELKSADEVFLTNTLMEIMPLAEIDGQRIKGGAMGRITRKISFLYRELVDKEISRPSRSTV